MQLSVRERRNEIGLRVAVGARSGDLVAQFVVESLTLAAVGGAAGVLLGALGAQLLSTLTRWQAPVTGVILGVALSSAIVTGVLFGAIPAWRAASLDPVEALRGE
jgi:putative ABC transport system permease protein